ncbi:hypothetical protein IAT38_003740 [Cryptococcus sp. DSM 104549]
MSASNPSQEDIEQFVSITQASHEDALHFLSSGSNLEGAIENFFAAQTAATNPSADQEDPSDDEEEDIPMDDEPQPPAPATGATGTDSGTGYTLSGQAVNDTLPAGWGRLERRTGGIKHGDDDEHAGHGHGPGGRDDDPEEFFTGGGKNSGLAVQNPDGPKSGNSLVDKILKQAQQNGPRTPSAIPGGGPAAAGGSSSSFFGGTGHTLGSDETPSSTVPAAGPAQPQAPPGAIPAVGGAAPTPADLLRYMQQAMGGGAGAGAAAAGPSGAGQADDSDSEDESNVQTRRLTFWRNGFSIEDGPLLSYDDPANKRMLEELEQGRAPNAAFNVQWNQRLNVEVAQRRREDYQPPPKKPVKPFGGSGNRLGNPTPEVVSRSSSPMPGAMPQGILAGGSGSGSAAGAPPTNTGGAGQQTVFEVDDSKPVTNVQLRFGDGSRTVARVNLTHTVGDLRSYVAASRADPRPFVLQTTFPSRELSDPSETVEAAKLQNAVVVQRFT